MPISQELLRNTSELLPKFKVNGQLLFLGSEAAHCALGLSSLMLGMPIEEVRDLLHAGYEFLDKDLDEDLKMIEQGDKYPLSKRLEKTYDPRKIIKELFPKQVKAGEKITDKEIKKIRLKMKEWKKVLKNLSEGQLISDRKLENLQVTLTDMSEIYLRGAHKYTQGLDSGMNID